MHAHTPAPASGAPSRVPLGPARGAAVEAALPAAPDPPTRAAPRPVEWQRLSAAPCAPMPVCVVGRGAVQTRCAGPHGAARQAGNRPESDAEYEAPELPPTLLRHQRTASGTHHRLPHPRRPAHRQPIRERKNLPRSPERGESTQFERYDRPAQVSTVATIQLRRSRNHARSTARPGQTAVMCTLTTPPRPAPEREQSRGPGTVRVRFIGEA